MRRVMDWRRGCGLVLLSVGAWGMTACGHGSGDGELEIENERSSRREFCSAILRPMGKSEGEFHEECIEPGDYMRIYLDPSFYEVTVIWENGRTDSYFAIPVRKDDTTVLEVEY